MYTNVCTFHGCNKSPHVCERKAYQLTHIIKEMRTGQIDLHAGRYSLECLRSYLPIVLGLRMTDASKQVRQNPDNRDLYLVRYTASIHSYLMQILPMV